MIHHPNKHHRRSIRIPGFDYAQPGAYYITICAQNRVYLFGDVVNNKMRLNDAGLMVKRWWNTLCKKFPMIHLDEYVVMPNHFHGIIHVCDVVDAGIDISERADTRVCPYVHHHPPIRNDVGADQCVRPITDQCVRPITDQCVRPMPISAMVQWFKTMTTNEYIRDVKQKNWSPFSKKLWQRNYYEHVIRDEESLNRVRQYIMDNPRNWTTDENNPNAPHQRS